MASCSDCHTGVLVEYEIDANLPNGPQKLGICVLCPDLCATCEHGTRPRNGQPDVHALRCTSCKARTTLDMTAGTCHKCPENC